MGLVAVGIAEGDVDAGKFFVLQKDANPFRKSEVSAEGELAAAVAIFVGVAVAPKFFFEIFALALDMPQARAFDLEHHWRTPQVAVFAVEMIAGGGIAHEGAVDGRWRRKNFAGGEIWTVAGIRRAHLSTPGTTSTPNTTSSCKKKQQPSNQHA